MKKTGLEEEILEDLNRLKESWGNKAPLRLSLKHITEPTRPKYASRKPTYA